MSKPEYFPLSQQFNNDIDTMRLRAANFLSIMSTRRTVRQFSERHIPCEVINDCLQAAAKAPSGANLQPWHFVVVTSPNIKKEIRKAAEVEEHEFYTHRATPEWLALLEPLGTDEHKPFLEAAPYLIAIFVQTYGVLADKTKIKHYYAMESVGIATGILITALHHAGLATLTHTPSPMNFLNRILKRPANEKPFLLLVTGFPAEDALVPKISKKCYNEIVTYL